MTDLDLRALERMTAASGSQDDADRLLIAWTRAGLVDRPELVPPALARGRERVTCSLAIALEGTGFILLPVPCIRVTPYPGGRPGATYDFMLVIGHPYVGLTIEAVAFHDARGRVLSWKAQSLYLSSAYEVKFTWLLSPPAAALPGIRLRLSEPIRILGGAGAPLAVPRLS